MKDNGTSLMRTVGLAALLLCGASLSLAGGTPALGIAKAFGTSTLLLNGSTSLTITLNNFIGSPYGSVGVSDPLPAGLVVSNPTGAVNHCGGTFNPNPGDTSVSLTGGSLSGGASCTFSVNVTGTTLGLKNNTTGQVTSPDQDAPGGTANASLTVVSAVDSASIPTLSEWALFILSALMAAAAFIGLRRRGV